MNTINRIVQIIFIAIFISCLSAEAKTLSGNVNESLEKPTKDVINEFRIVFTSEIQGQLARDGEQVEARLENDIKMGNRVIAPAGSVVLGNIEDIVPSRKLMKSVTARKDKFRRHGSLLINFNKIITPNKEQINIALHIPEQVSVFNINGVFRKVMTGASGEVLKAEDTDNFNPFGDITIPKHMNSFKERHEVHIMPGDQIKVKVSQSDIDQQLHSVSSADTTK